jgi:two-component system phosphate regulon response regulator OmpR
LADAGCILVVDDDASLREMLAEYLGSHGFSVSVAPDGESMRAEIERVAPDVVLLDLRLPREDGLSLARYLREHYDIGIIMVTGSGEVVDRIVGLEVGADDYVTKPFDPRELLARVKSVMRRMHARPAPAAASSGDGAVATASQAPRIRFGRCELDVEARRVFGPDGREVALTAMEFDLLKVFAEHPGKALSRDRLLTLTRNREWDPYDRSIDIRVARLRRKIGDGADEASVIRTVRGVGYMYVPR